MESRNLLGTYRELYEAQTAFEELRSHRGGGDVVTSLLVYGLNYGLFDRALVVKMSQTEPWKAIPTIAKTPDEVIEAAGSKYAFVPFSALSEQLTEKSVGVGLPCQISTRGDYFKIGLFCGIIYTKKGLDYFLRQNDIRKEDISSMDYRAPRTRRMVIELKSGVRKELLYPWWLGYFFHDKRCLYCQDYTNHHADISVGDRRPGYSAVIVRTQRGQEIFHQAVETNYIKAKKLSLRNFLQHHGSSLMQKEARGGFINSKLVTMWGDWSAHLPLRVLHIIGTNISRRLR
ncbi:MAG: Coenzyme F420 hydrogenase/dehydrogenase, beta subunit C-terminal domain [Dehalococcoidia bacterium]|nr:Coenzyme F420 hydrogenase/dehydrogenase, beta subunit C-terminal domain [Dehalococcoidia bacterium]